MTGISVRGEGAVSIPEFRRIFASETIGFFCLFFSRLCLSLQGRFA